MQNTTYSASDGINGGTVCNFIFIYLFISPCSLFWPHLWIFLAQICQCTRNVLLNASLTEAQVKL